MVALFSQQHSRSGHLDANKKPPKNNKVITGEINDLSSKFQP
jgi:hypothetical protein